MSLHTAVMQVWTFAETHRLVDPASRDDTNANISAITLIHSACHARSTRQVAVRKEQTLATAQALSAGDNADSQVDPSSPGWLQLRRAVARWITSQAHPTNGHRLELQDEVLDNVDRNPDRQHTVKVKQFLDQPGDDDAPPCAHGSESELGQPLPRLLPPGRRGSWLVPLLGQMPVASVSAASWQTDRSTLPAPSRVRENSIDEIKWTEDRLAALWRVLKTLASNGRMGLVRASCEVTHNDDSWYAWPPLIRIGADAHLALPLRSLLGLVSAQGDTSGEGRHFLRNATLLWIDEAGVPVLTA
ncbi:hypothetical protein ACM66B_004818 [Microbotryomycetes sp. NB124-2]